MKTLVVIITHANTASAFLEAVKNMHIETDSNTVLAYDIQNNDEPKLTCEKILKKITAYSSSALFITDLIGSTPYNIAKNACKDYKTQTNQQTALITGLNLPMLLKVLTYQNLPAPALAEKARVASCDSTIYEA